MIRLKSLHRHDESTIDMFLHTVLFISGIFQLWFALSFGAKYPRNRTESPLDELYHIQKVFNQLQQQMKGSEVMTHHERRDSDLASQKLEELREFFEKVKMMTAAPRPTTNEASAPPHVRNPIKMIFTRVGVGFRYTIAHDTFYDNLDGDALRLNLDLLTSDKSKLFPNSWIKLDKTKLEIYGFPLMGNKGKYTYHLKATNNRGISSYNTFLAYVYANFEFYNHDLVICTTMSFSTYASFVDKRIALVARIAKYVLGTDLENVWVRKFEKGCLSTTFKHLPARGRCNHEAIETIERKVFLDGKINPEFIKALKSVTEVTAVNLTLTGACAKKSSNSDAEELEWLKALAPVIILVGIVAIPTCVSCLVCREVRRRQARMRQLQDKKLKEDHATMIVQAQEYKRECGLDDDSDEGCDAQNSKKVRFSDIHEEDGPLLGKIAEMILPEAFVDTVNKGSELLGMIMPATTSANQDGAGINVVTESIPGSRRPSRNPLSHLLDISNPRNEMMGVTMADPMGTAQSAKSSRGLVDVLRNPLEITTPATERASKTQRQSREEETLDSIHIVTSKPGLLSGIKNFFAPAITVTPKSPSTESVAVTTTSSSIGSRIALLLNPWTSFSSEDQQMEQSNAPILDSMEDLNRIDNDYIIESFNQSMESGDGPQTRSVSSSIADSQSLNMSRCETPIREKKGLFTSIKDIFSLVNNATESDDKNRDSRQPGTDSRLVPSSGFLSPQGFHSDNGSLRYRRYSSAIPYLQANKGFKAPDLSDIRSTTLRHLKKLDRKKTAKYLSRTGSFRNRKKTVKRKEERNANYPLKEFLTPDMPYGDYVDKYLSLNEVINGQGLRRWNSCSPEQFLRDDSGEGQNSYEGVLPRRSSFTRRGYEGSSSARNSFNSDNQEYDGGLYGSEILLPRFDSEDSVIFPFNRTQNGSVEREDSDYQDYYRSMRHQLSDESQASSGRYRRPFADALDHGSRKHSDQSTGSRSRSEDTHCNNYRAAECSANSFQDYRYIPTSYPQGSYYQGNNTCDSDGLLKKQDQSNRSIANIHSGEIIHSDYYSGNSSQPAGHNRDCLQQGDDIHRTFVQEGRERYALEVTGRQPQGQGKETYLEDAGAPIIVYSTDFQEPVTSIYSLENSCMPTASTPESLSQGFKRKGSLRKSIIKQRSVQENINRLEVPEPRLQRRNSLPFEPGSSFDDDLEESGYENQNMTRIYPKDDIASTDSYDLTSKSFDDISRNCLCKDRPQDPRTVQKTRKPSLCWQPLFSDDQSYTLSSQRRRKENNAKLDNNQGREEYNLYQQGHRNLLYPSESPASLSCSSLHGSGLENQSYFTSTKLQGGTEQRTATTPYRLSPVQIYERPDFARTRLSSIGRSRSDPFSSYDDGNGRFASPLYDEIYAQRNYDQVISQSSLPFYEDSQTVASSSTEISDFSQVGCSATTSQYDYVGFHPICGPANLAQDSSQRSSGYAGIRHELDDFPLPAYRYNEPCGYLIQQDASVLDYSLDDRLVRRRFGNDGNTPVTHGGSPDVSSLSPLGLPYHRQGQLSTSMDTLESIRGYPDGNSGSPEVDNSSPQPDIDQSDPTPHRYNRVIRQSTSGSSTSDSTRSRRISRGLERQRRVEEDDSCASSPSPSNIVSIQFNPLADIAIDKSARNSDRGYPDGDNSSNAPPVRQYTSTKSWYSDLKDDTALHRLALRRSVYGKSASADERQPDEKQLSRMRSLSMDLEGPYISDEDLYPQSVPDLTTMITTTKKGSKKRISPSTTPDKGGSLGSSKRSSPASRMGSPRKRKLGSMESHCSSLVESNYFDATGEYIQGGGPSSRSKLSEVATKGMKGHVLHAGRFVKSMTGKKRPFGNRKGFVKSDIFKQDKRDQEHQSEGPFMGSLLNRIGERGFVNKFQSRLGNKDRKLEKDIKLQTMGVVDKNPSCQEEYERNPGSLRVKLAALAGPKL